MHDYVVVDPFTRRPLDGNPVAVFFDCEDLTTHLMQRIANEMHLSETTFVLPPRSAATLTSASSLRSTSCRSPGTPCSEPLWRSLRSSARTSCSWKP